VTTASTSLQASAAEALVRIRELEQQLGIELANKSANEE
jgi:hypothetical protein